MKVGIGTDHGGYILKETVVEVLAALGHDVTDYGAHDESPTDYPDPARAVGEAVARGEVERGVLLCGSGVGVAIAANKVQGVRACLCHDTYSARQGVEHDAMNVLCLGGRIIGTELAGELVRSFMSGQFSGEDRHCRRLNKVLSIEGASKSASSDR